MQGLKAIYVPGQKHWDRTILPDGKTIGYLQAKILRRIWKYGPIAPSELRELFGELSDLVFDYREISKLRKKDMIKRAGRLPGSKEGRFVATDYGMEVIMGLKYNGKLEEIETHESS